MVISRTGEYMKSLRLARTRREELADNGPIWESSAERKISSGAIEDVLKM